MYIKNYDPSPEVLAEAVIRLYQAVSPTCSGSPKRLLTVRTISPQFLKMTPSHSLLFSQLVSLLSTEGSVSVWCLIISRSVKL